MEITQAIIALIPVAIAAEGGVESLFNLIATLQKSGKLDQAEIDRIRTEGALEDALFDSSIEAAKHRIGQK